MQAVHHAAQAHPLRRPDPGAGKIDEMHRRDNGRRLGPSRPYASQNKLTELWSLFDFVFPGKLGTLPTFEEQFSLPIAGGTYANASSFKRQTAYQCSLVLRDLLRPYMLRRLKADVALHLPSKTEKVLFCHLTDAQRDAYEEFLDSDQVDAVLHGRGHAFAVLTTLLKICNHPHLHSWTPPADAPPPKRRAAAGGAGASAAGGAQAAEAEAAEAEAAEAEVKAEAAAAEPSADPSA